MVSDLPNPLVYGADGDVTREKRESRDVRDGMVSLWLTGDRAEISYREGKATVSARGLGSIGIQLLTKDRR